MSVTLLLFPAFPLPLFSCRLRITGAESKQAVMLEAGSPSEAIHGLLGENVVLVKADRDAFLAGANAFDRVHLIDWEGVPADFPDYIPEDHQHQVQGADPPHRLVEGNRVPKSAALQPITVYLSRSLDLDPEPAGVHLKTMVGLDKQILTVGIDDPLGRWTGIRDQVRDVVERFFLGTPRHEYPKS